MARARKTKRRAVRAKARKVKGVMNGLERRFHDWLIEQRYTPRYEAITFRLADRTTYCPDFMVQAEDATLTFYEVKGYWGKGNGRVKVKVAAELYPEFRFVGVQWRDNAWTFEAFPPAEEET